MSGRKRRALLVALLAACAAVAAFSHPAFAEQAVGLEAQGVDPWAALHNDQGLDVRDAQGHPVSADLIRQQLAAAHAKSVVAASLVSRLPKAKLIFKLIDLVAALGGAWRNAYRLPSPQEVFALPLRVRRLQRVSAPQGVSVLITLVLALCCCRTLLLSRSSLQKSEVLRC